jgi:hypothetical protein
MALYDDILSGDPKYTEAHRKSDGRGDPSASGFGRRITRAPSRAGRFILITGAQAFALFAAATLLFHIIGAV